MEDLAFEPERTAVLSMDLQTGIVAIYAKDDPALPGRAAKILESARSRKVSVIHVQAGFRPGLPEVSVRNPLFGAIKRSPLHQQLFLGPAGTIHSTVAPQADDIVVTKHRICAFAGTDLEMILRAKEIDTLILFGIATSGVVLSTFLHASDQDYRLIVVKDCCADLDAGGHNYLVERLFPSLATVTTSAQLIDALAPR
ncbi:MAG: isochorismatase family cysteine hydrolase [Acidobacteriaceae bacterium]